MTVAQGTVDWTTFAGRLIYNVQQEGKHAYLRDLSRNTLRGTYAAAKRGEWINKPLYGYSIENKRLVLGSPEEVEIVRRIFREYLAGYSIRSILLRLNAEGIRTQYGHLWTPNTLRDKLVNPAYCGRYVWHQERKGKYHSIAAGEITADFTRGPCDPSEWIVIENNHPAIIDVETFNQVQRTLTERKSITTPGGANSVYLFTGICRCGKCGGKMDGITKNGIPRLQCADHNSLGVCDLNGVRQDVLLENVLRELEERFTEPKRVERLRAILLGRVSRQVEAADPAELRKQLEKLDADLTKARRNMALADGDDLRRDYEAVVRELRQERERLETSLHNAQKPPGRTQAEVVQRIDQAIDALSRLRETLRANDLPRQREFLRKCFAKIETWSERDPEDGRGAYRLQKGKIHLRPDMWLPSRQDLLVPGCRTALPRSARCNRPRYYCGGRCTRSRPP